VRGILKFPPTKVIGQTTRTVPRNIIVTFMLQARSYVRLDKGCLYNYFWRIALKRLGLLVLGLFCLPYYASSQGDMAIYDTFSRFSPAVYSINVEIPKDYILERHQLLVKQFRDLQDNYSDIVSDGSSALGGQYMFKNVMNAMRRKLDLMKEQMLSNNRVRGAGFAIGPHHILTLSTVVKSATFGAVIAIKDDYHWISQATLQGLDELSGIAVLHVADVTFSNYVDLKKYVSHQSSNDSLTSWNQHQLPIASYVMAIQRPYNLPASPFSGVIGGYNRLLGLYDIEKYIQTDLPFYPGNEGAPVFSPSGKLVGVMASEFCLGRWPGITFLIPTDIIADSALAIIRTGKRERGWISGVGLGQNINGIVVEEVIPKSSAAEAGLKKGDLILGFNGRREKRVWNLIDFISKTEPNEIIRFEVKRGSRLHAVNVKTTLRQIRKTPKR